MTSETKEETEITIKPDNEAMWKDFWSAVHELQSLAKENQHERARKILRVKSFTERKGESKYVNLFEYAQRLPFSKVFIRGVPEYAQLLSRAQKLARYLLKIYSFRVINQCNRCGKDQRRCILCGSTTGKTNKLGRYWQVSADGRVRICYDDEGHLSTESTCYMLATRIWKQKFYMEDLQHRPFCDYH